MNSLSFSKATYFPVEVANKLLQDAEIRQRESRLFKRHSCEYPPVYGGTHTVQEHDEADLYMGRIIYFLQAQGHPIIICRDVNHLLDIEKGIPYFFDVLDVN